MGKTDRTRLSLMEAKRLARKYIQSETGRSLPIVSAKAGASNWVIEFDPANGGEIADDYDFIYPFIIVIVDKDTEHCETFWTL